MSVYIDIRSSLSKGRGMFREDDSGLSEMIGFMFILAAIVIFASVVYPAMVRNDIKTAENNAFSNIYAKMLQFSDDMQSATAGQTSFQLTSAQEHSSASTSSLVFQPDTGTFVITTTNHSTYAPPYAGEPQSGLITITPNNFFAKNIITAFQLGAVVEEQDNKYWSSTSSFLSIIGRNVTAQFPVLTGGFLSSSGGTVTLKYNVVNMFDINDTNTNAVIVINTPYPDVFENAFQNDMNRAGFTRNTDYILTEGANAVTLHLKNLNSINIKVIIWSVS